MKIVAISDIHGYLEPAANMPAGDVLCICGDIAPLDIQRNLARCVSWFCLDFVPWVDSLPYEKVIFIGGNHDFFLDHLAKGNMGIYLKDAHQVMEDLLVGKHKTKHKKLVYLFDSSFTYKRVTFYGTPWIVDLPSWAFNKEESDEAEKVWEKIPEKVDVLLTHMPSHIGSVGTVLQTTAYNYLSFYGSYTLANAIEKRDIKYALCGHVHTGEHHPFEHNGTTYVNVSIKNEDYKVDYRPFVFEV